MTTTSTTDFRALESQYVLQTYRRQPVLFERGSGMHLYDDQGRKYLDFLSGIGVASLGHSHPALARALADQAATLVHTSNLYFHPLQGQLAARLSALTGLDRAFFCNSGTEAVEACLKFARRYWHTQGETGRTKYVAFTHSFHGRTMGALSVTADEHYRGPFAPLVPGVSFASASDLDTLDQLVDGTTAAIIVEPIQGEGGVRPISPAAARAIAEASARTGALLIADEVQSGSFRTGAFLYGPAIGLAPDLIALGKALGAGVPVGAAMVSGKVAKTISAGDHGHDVRRQPARVPCGARVSRHAGERPRGQRLARVRALVCGPARAAGTPSARDRRRARRRSDGRARIRRRRGARRRSGAQARVVDQPDGHDGHPAAAAVHRHGRRCRCGTHDSGRRDEGDTEVTDLTIRQATAADAAALHALISAHRAEGHLLPRELNELARHAGRFVVCDVDGDITACAELAPLSSRAAEVRSLVVSKDFRRVGLAARLVSELTKRARGHRVRDRLCVHARRAVFRPPEFLDRAARVAAGEDHDRLSRLPVVQEVRAARHDAVAARAVACRRSLDGRAGPARGRRRRLTRHP
jgi:acetylornithine/succinyldiaminopimelate/putrescine aminotransferase/N-acetylglutamate synthase-like GNAT family acetyltransferase